APLTGGGEKGTRAAAANTCPPASRWRHSPPIPSHSARLSTRAGRAPPATTTTPSEASRGRRSIHCSMRRKCARARAPSTWRADRATRRRPPRPAARVSRRSIFPLQRRERVRQGPEDRGLQERGRAQGPAGLALQRVRAAVRGVPHRFGPDAGPAARPVRYGARRDPRRGRQGRGRIRESRDGGDPRARRTRDGAEAVIPGPARKIMRRPGKWFGPHKAIEIVEEDGVRVLQIGGNAIQSAMRLDAPDRIELDYVRAMMAFLLFHPSPRDVLLVGLGGGSMARFIHQRLPRTRVTVVEIDPGVVTVARRYFRFPEEDARLQIVIGDGAEAV